MRAGTRGVRYTRDVVRFRCPSIAALALAAFVSLPVGGTVCAMLCVPTESPALADDGRSAGLACHEADAARAGIGGSPAHECDSHHGPRPNTTAAMGTARTSHVPSSPAGLPASVAPAVVPLVSLAAGSGSGPPLSVPSLRSPLVLRI